MAIQEKKANLNETIRYGGINKKINKWGGRSVSQERILKFGYL